MAINDVSDISFNNLAQNAKNYKSKIQDKKKNNYSMNMSKRTEKNISDLVISSNKAILLATKLANENNKKFSAQYANIPDRLKQIKKEKARIKKEITVSGKSPTMAVLSIDKNVKKIYNLLNRKFGTATSKKSKNLLDASAVYDAKKLGMEGTGKKWKADVFALVKAAMRQSTLSSLKVDQDTYYHSRFGEGEKKKGFLGSAVRAYKVASDETTMSTQEKMVKALIEINNSLSGKESVFRLTYERLLMENTTFRNIVWTLQKGQDVLMAIPRIYRWASKSRGGYKSTLPRGMGSAEHTAAVLDMIYVDSMWRLDNIVHHLKQQYNLWNKYVMSQTGSSADDPTDISKGTYSYIPKLSTILKKLVSSSSKDAPEYKKYQVTSKDLLEKQVKIGYTQVALLKIIASSTGTTDVKKQVDRITVGRTDADNRLDEDDYYTNKKHTNRLLFWRANAKLEKDKQSKFEKTQAKIEENKKKIETRKANILAKRKWKAYKKDPNGYAKDLNDQASENLNLAMQAGPAHLAIAAGKKIGKSKIYKSTIAKMKGFNESASDKIDNAKNKAVAGTYKFLSPNSSPSRVKEAANKQLAGQDNITDRLVLKMDQLISENSIANKLSRNSYRLSFKSFLADEKARFKAKHKDSWWYKAIGKVSGFVKKGFLSLISVLTLGMGVKGFIKHGLKKAGAALLNSKRLASGVAGVGMAAYDAYGGVKKAKEWGTNKFIGGVAGALGGAGDGGVGSALKGAAKGGGIGMMIGGPLGAAIGGIAGGLLGYFGGKNIAKALNPVWEGIKKLWAGIKKMVMFPIDIMKWTMEKFMKLFGSLKDLASNGLSTAYAWLYDKTPDMMKFLLPKPKGKVTKTPEESAKDAIAAVSKKKSDNAPSLVDPALLAAVASSKKSAALPTVTDKLRIASEAKNDEVKTFGFDRVRLSPDQQQKEKDRQAKYKKEAPSRAIAAGLRALPTTGEAVESAKGFKQKSGNYLTGLWQDTKYVAKDLAGKAGTATQTYIDNSPKLKKLQTNFDKEYPNLWDKVKTFADIKKIQAEGIGNDLLFRFRKSDVARKMEILAIQGEYNWKKFKQSNLYKQASEYGLTSEKRFNAAMSAITGSPSYLKLKGAAANKDNRWNENDIRQGVADAGKKGKELKETTQENISTVLSKKDLVHKKTRTDLIHKKKKKKIDWGNISLSKDTLSDIKDNVESGIDSFASDMSDSQLLKIFYKNHKKESVKKQKASNKWNLKKKKRDIAGGVSMNDFEYFVWLKDNFRTEGVFKELRRFKKEFKDKHPEMFDRIEQIFFKFDRARNRKKVDMQRGRNTIDTSADIQSFLDDPDKLIDFNHKRSESMNRQSHINEARSTVVEQRRAIETAKQIKSAKKSKASSMGASQPSTKKMTDKERKAVFAKMKHIKPLDLSGKKNFSRSTSTSMNTTTVTGGGYTETRRDGTVVKVGLNGKETILHSPTVAEKADYQKEQQKEKDSKTYYSIRKQLMKDTKFDVAAELGVTLTSKQKLGMFRSHISPIKKAIDALAKAKASGDQKQIDIARNNYDNAYGKIIDYYEKNQSTTKDSGQAQAFKNSKGSGKRAYLLAYKNVNSKLKEARSKGNDADIAKWSKAKTNIESKMKGYGIAPPVMTSKDIASAQIEQEKIKATNQDKSLNSALGKQTTQINKNQQESTNHIVSANSSMASTIVNNNSSSVQNTNNGGGGGNQKPQQSDAYGDAVMAGQFDNM